MRVVIISGGNIPTQSILNKYITKNSYIICADSGFDALINTNIKPNLCVGDMDSVKSSLAGQTTKIYPKNKDKTDTEIAVDIAIKKGATEVILLGCYGTRLDHTLSNINMLKILLEHNIYGKMVDSNNIVMLCDSQIQIKSAKNCYCSLISLTQCTGVTTHGLKYSLKNENLSSKTSRGISNEFNSNLAAITIKSGLLLIIISKD